MRLKSHCAKVFSQRIFRTRCTKKRIYAAVREPGVNPPFVAFIRSYRARLLRFFQFAGFVRGLFAFVGFDDVFWIVFRGFILKVFNFAVARRFFNDFPGRFSAGTAPRHADMVKSK